MNALLSRLRFLLSPARPGRAVRRAFYATPVYALMLKDRGQFEIRGTVPDPRPGTPEKATPILAGMAPWNEAARWTVTPGTDPVMGVQGFRWLADLRADDTERARLRARELIDDWTARHRTWSEPAFAPDVTAERLTHWLTSAGFLFTGSDTDFRSRFLGSIAAQARHLCRTVTDVDGAARFLAIKGLVYAGLTLPGGASHLQKALRLLAVEADRQIGPDGGHVERNPERTLDVLRQLVDIRAGLVAARIDVPHPLQGAIDRLAPLVRALRLGDGGLALFNGGTEGDAAMADAVLALAAVRGKALVNAPHAGFQRISALRTTLIMDTGTPPPPGLDGQAHAGTLGFELSVGRDRLIVNCGAHPFGPAVWRDALRATAAHSTVTVAATNSTAIKAGGGTGWRRPKNVTVIRREDDGDTWLETSHDGYAKPFGLTHARHIYLAADGEEMRGRDSLIGETRHPFAVRFHLHPDVRASLMEGGAQVLLRLPSGQGWRFRATGGEVKLEDSAYFGDHGAPGPRAGASDPHRRSQQIVVAVGPDNTEATVKWRLALEPRRSP